MNNKTKFIVIEGLDGTGKTTFVNDLVEKAKSNGLHVGTFHNSSIHERTIEWYLKMFEMQQNEGYDLFIWDRGFIGPFIWPFFFKGQEFTIDNPSRVQSLFDKFDITVLLPSNLKQSEYKIIADRRIGEYKEEFKYIQKLFEGISKLVVPKEKLIMYEGLLDMNPIVRERTIKMLSKKESE